MVDKSTYVEGYREPNVCTLVGGKAIIFNTEGKLLLLRRSEKLNRAGGWDFPGGGVEYGEDPLKAIEREIGEETGLTVHDIRTIHAASYPITKPDQDFIVMIGYKAKTKDEKVHLSWEHSEYKWVTREEALQYNLPHMHRSFIEKL
jgi:8-oxo-dGTP diphosphatase